MLRITALILLARLAACDVDPEVQEKYETLPIDDFVEYFNKRNFSYKIFNYYKDVKSLPVTGAHLDVEDVDIRDLPVLSHDPRLFHTLPKNNFDARQKWPQCKTISEIYDQGACSSWAFVAANVASDRTCIHKNIHVHLSEQDFECLNRDVCNGGNPLAAVMFWRDSGLVTQECKPYNITKLRENVCTKECINKDMDYTKDKHYAERVYTIWGSNEHIKAELFKNGPLHVSFYAYDDIYYYKEGIYEHKFGRWSVVRYLRFIGYGVENDIEYWLVANSWSKNWGEQGLIRVKIMLDDFAFGSMVIGGIPKS